MLPCPFKKFFGIECPGCGAQRAFLLFWQGSWKSAFHLYPAIFTLVLLGLVFVINFFDKKRNYGKSIVSLIIINLVIIFGSYFLKMS